MTRIPTHLVFHLRMVPPTTRRLACVCVCVCAGPLRARCRGETAEEYVLGRSYISIMCGIAPFLQTR
jgi:hypothetical protein